MKVYDAADIRNVALVGHSGAARRSSSRRCSSTPAPSTAWARSTTAPPSPTSTTKRSPASTPSPPASPTPSGTRPRSTSSTRPGSPTSSPTRAPRCAWPSRAGRRRRRRRRRGADREALEDAAGAQPPAHRRRSTAGSRARQPRAHARIAPPRCGREIVPIQLPIGEEKDFTGVIDLVSDEGADVRQPTAAAR